MSGTAEGISASLAGNRKAPPAFMTIFGAAGDLTKRLVVPALYNLVRAGRFQTNSRLLASTITR